MAKSINAKINPALLEWARKNAGLTPEAAAQRLNVSAQTLLDWEGGNEPITIAQLDRAAKLYKRPLAVMYLPEPPKDFAAMRNDFRRLPELIASAASHELELVLRLANERRDVAVDLAKELDHEPPTLDVVAADGEKPAELARRLRAALGVTLDEQAAWKGDGYATLAGWRTAVERRGVLVFQFGGLEVVEVRGFSIASTPYPVVGLNSRDAPLGRVFTIAHELAHVALRSGLALCDLGDEEGREVFCNAVAGELLVPGDALAQALPVRAFDAYLDEDIGALARRFSVSREVAVRRLLDTGRVSRKFYAERRAMYQRFAKPVKGGAVPIGTRIVAAAGRPYVELVLSAYGSGAITGSDVADYLGVKLEHLQKIRDAAAPRGAPAAYATDAGDGADAADGE